MIEEALSRTLAGQALALAGDREQAKAELQRAATTLDRCGAPRLRNAADRELRELGRPVDRRSRKGSAEGAGVDTLTGTRARGCRARRRSQDEPREQPRTQGGETNL